MVETLERVGAEVQPRSERLPARIAVRLPRSCKATKSHDSGHKRRRNNCVDRHAQPGKAAADLAFLECVSSSNAASRHTHREAPDNGFVTDTSLTAETSQSADPV